jgi:geranylgeranyl diphosphate synthase, type I
MTMTLSPTLLRSRDTVLPAMRAAVERMDPTSAAISSYHLGWTDEAGQAQKVTGGKALRPALALLSARAAGAPAEIGVPGAVAVELVHNFSLVHDDVMDGDTERRHRRTVWAVWGIPAAILTGDAMLTVAQEVLLDSGSPHTIEALRVLLNATRELIRGQVDDVAFEKRDDVGLAECQQMAAGKTGALLAASAAIGAVLAGAPVAMSDALASYGEHLGAAFQLVDDLLGIWGDPTVTGKPVLSDLRSRKRSLPVTYALTRGGAAGRELGEWLRTTGDDTESDLLRAAQLVEDGGGRRWAAREAERRMRLAQAALEAGQIPADVRDELNDLARFVVTRDA